MRFIHLHERRPEVEPRARREHLARFLASYLRRVPASYIAPMSRTQVVLTWLVVGPLFLGLFLLFGWMTSAPPPGAH